MIETCLKCGHVNKASTGDDSEACPQCGAVYSKVELAMAAKRTPQARELGKNFWTYAVLSGLLLVLVPLTVYEHTWGSSEPESCACRAARTGARSNRQS
jgi:hypothetical protein